MPDRTIIDAIAPDPLLPKWDGKGGYITTFTGKQFMLAEPTVEMIDILDIGHALSMICHFGGHCAQFFSVAQHSVLVSRAAKELGHDKQFRQWALMHDAAEAYVGDMTRPLKVLLPDYKVIEKRIMHVIVDAFNMSWPEPEGLKKIDDSILKLEAKMLMTGAVLHDGRGVPYDLQDPPELPQEFIAPMTVNTARSVFMREFDILFKDDDGL